MENILNTLQLTFRGFDPAGGADVGVIVTDGVMVKFELVLECPNELRWGGPPGISVAPPGNDERGGGNKFCARPGVGCPLNY